ncbi:MAG: FISUMP domain-containing protein [Flavobacteriaceae bacterium]|jgi:hypothetical protein|nr:FISUMP domain-containing protein [Flavobacteriaceae bacterium]
MIAGHFTTALIAKQKFPKGTLLYFLIISQLQDFLWFTFHYLGLEPTNPSDAFDATLNNMAVDMLYSHDLLPQLFCWNSSPDLGAIGNDQSLNNSSGFNAFPEGYRKSNGTFANEGTSAVFWSSTENYTNYAWFRLLYTSTSNLYWDSNLKQEGSSVRFVRD